MKKVMVLTMAAVLVGVGGLVWAGGGGSKKKSKADALHGKLVSVTEAKDGEKGQIVVETMVKDDEGHRVKKEVTLDLADEVTVNVDGEDAKLSDLKAGMMITASPKDGPVTDISARTPKSKKKKDDAGE
jgi:hypothetical protein